MTTRSFRTRTGVGGIARLAPLRRPLGLLLPSHFAPQNYIHAFSSYAHALATFGPGVPLEGPAVAKPARDVDWIASLLASRHPGLGLVSGHRYPYSACVHNPLAPAYPTIPRLLSERATAGMARELEPAVRLAHSAGLPFRLTELNSVTRGGLPGVSNTFATALWAPDALFELLRGGVDGVNVHVRHVHGQRSFRADVTWARGTAVAVRPDPARAFGHSSIGCDARRPAAERFGQLA